MKTILDTIRSLATRLSLAALMLGSAWVSPANGQDPFAGPGKAPAGAAPAAAGAAGAPAADAKGTKGKAAPESVVSEPKPLLLQYLEEHKPTTPEQFLKAAQIMLNIGRADESKKYLVQFLEAKPEAVALAEVGRKLGPAFFLRLLREKEIQPEGGQIASLVLDAMHQSARDPMRVRQLIPGLASPDEGKRAVSRAELAEGGDEAVMALLEVLADSGQVNLHRQAQIALVEMKLVSEGPLVAALESGDEGQLIKVIETLGAMASRAAMPRLVRLSVDAATSAAVRAAAADALASTIGKASRPAEAEHYLQKVLEEKLAQAKVLQPALDEPVKVWQWDPMAKAPVAKILPPGDAALVEAAQTAADLNRLAPKNAYYSRLHLMTALEEAKVLTGLDRPLPKGDGTAAAMAAQAGAAAVNGVLAEALKRDRVVAATAAAESLQTIADSQVLRGVAGNETPLAQALRHSDRRLRITAALAIAKIAPRESFTGASRVVETLAHFAGTGGARRVLIGHPRGQPGQTLVGYMNQMGYEAEVAPTGRSAQQKIVENADYEFLLLSDSLDAPAMKEVVQWLRRDYRTARLPVGVMARGENLEALREELEDDRLTYVFPAIADVEVAAELVRRLERMAGRSLIGRDERLEMAAAALDALARLAQQSPPAPSYDVLRHEGEIIRALPVPGLSAKAASVLGILATPKIQTALLEFANQSGRPIADRQAAAAAFAEAVKRRGILLTKAQIRVQYDRYNASETLDAQTQQVLGSILDTIESRSVAAVEKQP